MTFPVDWEDIVWTDCERRTRDLHSRNGDVYFVIHHSVTTRIQDTIATFKSDREVSATFAIGPTVAGSDDIKIARTVPEDWRPWTTASSIDDRALTTEVCDKELGGSYPISQNAKQKCAEIAAYMHTEYGMPLDRTHILTHQEVYGRGMGSYATACAGGDMQASMDWIVQTATDIVNGTTHKKEDEDDEMSNLVLLRREKNNAAYNIIPGRMIKHVPNEREEKLTKYALRNKQEYSGLNDSDFGVLLWALGFPEFNSAVDKLPVGGLYYWRPEDGSVPDGNGGKVVSYK